MPAPGGLARLAACAGLAVGLEVAWLLAMASQELALVLARAMEGLGAGAGVVERGLDAAVLAPLVAIAASFGLRGPRPAAKAGRRAAAALRALPVVAAAALAIGYATHRDYLLYRAAAVAEGTLYRSGQTSGASLERLLRRDRIRTLLYLRSPGEDLDREREIAERRGVRFEHLPMSDRRAAVARFLDIMDDPANHPVLVHCRYGIARTGLLAGIYRIEYQGWEPHRALGEARRFSGYGGLEPGSSARAFLVGYSPRRSAPASGGAADP